MKTLLTIGLTMSLFTLSSWGFFAHEKINRLAVYTLPPELLPFFKEHINYLEVHASDPDKRRYVDQYEAPRHYIDLENFELNIDSIPFRYVDAEKKYGLEMLNKNGIVPWQIQRSFYALSKAFESKDSKKILKYAVELAHYVGDAHVPLHTSSNHNGQLTNQHGIHGFWESRVPELFFNQYNLVVGKATYISDPLQEAWRIVRSSNSLVDTVLFMQRKLDSTFRADQKFEFSKRKNTTLRQYSTRYSSTYQRMTNHSVERRMRASIHSIGSFWLSAWIMAGQPNLEKNDGKKNRLSN